MYTRLTLSKQIEGGLPSLSWPFSSSVSRREFSPVSESADNEGRGLSSLPRDTCTARWLVRYRRRAYTSCTADRKPASWLQNGQVERQAMIWETKSSIPHTNYGLIVLLAIFSLFKKYKYWFHYLVIKETSLSVCTVISGINIHLVWMPWKM